MHQKQIIKIIKSKCGTYADIGKPFGFNVLMLYISKYLNSNSLQN